MLYVDFNAGGKDYKLRLATRNIVALEKAIGMNPLGIFANGDSIPSVTTMVTILWCSLQKFQHGIGMNEAYDIFDDYIADGNSMTDFLTVIIDIYKASGLMKDDTTEKTDEEEEIEKN